MLHRIREAWLDHGEPFDGPGEIDETYMGGKERNKHARRKLKARLGTAGKTPVIGAKDRSTGRIAARVVATADAETLNSFVDQHSAPDAVVNTDGNSAYRGRANHEAVAHSQGEFVRGDVHTQGVESFWSMLKRAHKGTFPRLSAKHLQRYVSEFAGRHNIRNLDTIDQMADVVSGLVGKRLLYRNLIADNGTSAEAT